MTGVYCIIVAGVVAVLAPTGPLHVVGYVGMFAGFLIAVTDYRRHVTAHHRNNWRNLP
jgi:hypothetical protein